MGVIYKLREEVVDFIISQRQSNPLASCRQLAESTSQKFGLQLSKSSVHDVLKESGIITPRGRKPKDKFEIPQEKKKQIQDSLSQIKLLPDPASVIARSEATKQSFKEIATLPAVARNDTIETLPEHEGAGRIFLKAALWDLGIFSEDNIEATDWKYYLTYSKGIKVFLENNKSFFIDLPLPIERCIREMADGLVNNVKTFIAHKVSDEELFKACMDAQTGFKIINISIVDENDHELLEIGNIMEQKRKYLLSNRLFVESNEINIKERTKAIFISQTFDNSGFIDNLLNLRGFSTISAEENVVTLLIDDSYDNKGALDQAMQNLNNMYIYDDQNRLVRVNVR